MNSSRGQMRRDLLQSDVGNIDVSQEVPMGPPRQAYPRMGNRMPPQQAYPDAYWSEEPERRAYSLNQKSISSFFKHKGSRMHHGRSKGEFGGKDDDEEVMVDDSMSLMTYNDIRTSANKGGERYGYGGDTAPIIPTLVTRDHGNMSNVEYRKHLTAQKKSAMNAMARAQKVQNDGRAMSLQSYNSVNPMTQPNRMYPRYPVQGPYANERSNSMVQPPAQFQRNAFHGPGNQGPMPGPRPGPRAMSLMSSNVRPSNIKPSPGGFQAPPQQQSPLHRPSSDNLPPLQQQGPLRRLSSDNLPPLQQQGPLHRLSSDNLPPLQQQGYGQPQPLKTTLAPKDDARGHLNVIQLSAPQQNDWREKERLLAERERELKEKERIIEEQETLIKEKLNQKEQKPEAVRRGTASSQQRLSVADKDINLDPSPTLENGLKSLSVDDQNAAVKNSRVSMGTFVSAFSDNSPEKRRTVNPSGMYQLEEKHRSQFVTAQEFPATTQQASSTTLDEETSSLKDDTLTELNQDPSPDRKAKRSSLIKAKDFLRKLSTSSLNKDSDAQPVLQKTPSRLSTSSIPNSESSHYTPIHNREEIGTQRTIRTNINEAKLAKSSDLQDDPDAFIFDNTIGKPYVPTYAKKDEVVATNKFKTITISGEQLNILSENQELMSELTLVSTELAESIRRETVLEEQLKNSNDPSRGEGTLSLADFEIELRKKSSKIVELIQQLNNERLKRFIAEEQVLLTENGAKPSSIELLHKISALEDQLALRDSEVSQLKDQLSSLK